MQQDGSLTVNSTQLMTRRYNPPEIAAVLQLELTTPPLDGFW